MSIIKLHRTISDTEYIRAFRENNNALITRFYRQYQDNLCDFILGKFKVQSEADREDIFQESVARLWENIQRGKLSEDTLTSSLYKYVKSIVENATKEHIRKQKGSVILDIEYGHIKDVDTVGMEKMHYSEDPRITLIRRTVDEMGTPCAPLLLGFLWDKKSMAVLAQELGYSGADSAKTQKSKCMGKLTTKIKNLLKSSKQ